MIQFRLHIPLALKSKSDEKEVSVHRLQERSRGSWWMIMFKHVTLCFVRKKLTIIHTKRSDFHLNVLYHLNYVRY